MQTDNIITILILLILVGLSAFFSAAETAYTSLNRARLKTMAERKDKRAALALKLVDRYDRLLSTILIGNNIVNISASSLATVFFVRILARGGATVSTVVVTIVILMFGEISPKSLVKDSPEAYARAVAPVLQALMFVFTPLTAIFALWKRILSRLFKNKADQRCTEDELLTIVEEAAQDGGIGEDESTLIRSAIVFTDRIVADIYTPRVHIVGVEQNASKEETMRVFRESGYSRLPVYAKTIDNIIGVLHQKDFYNYAAMTDLPMDNVIKPPVFAPQSMEINDLLKLLQKEKAHMAVIADEYGGTLGIVTMEDILEELVGEIWDEHDEIVELFIPLNENHYRVDCSAELHKMAAMFDLETDSDALTVGGWVVEQFERIPVVGEKAICDNLSITVVRADSKRVYEIEIVVLSAEPEDAGKVKIRV